MQHIGQNNIPSFPRFSRPFAPLASPPTTAVDSPPPLWWLALRGQVLTRLANLPYRPATRRALNGIVGSFPPHSTAKRHL